MAEQGWNEHGWRVVELAHLIAKRCLAWIKVAWEQLEVSFTSWCFAKAKGVPIDSLTEANSFVERQTQHQSDSDTDIKDLQEMLEKLFLG